MYYLDVHQLYTRPTKAERVSVRRGLQRDKMMEQKLKNLRNRDDELASLFEPVEKGVVQIEPPLALAFDTPGGKQIHYRKWIDRINKHRYEPIKYRYLINNPPKKVAMAIVFRCDLFKEI